MKKQYHVFHADIGFPSGRTRELLNELIGSWHAGRNEGAGEIAAIAELLTTPEAVPHINYPMGEGGMIARLAQEFGIFLNDMPSKMDLAAMRLIGDLGMKENKFYIGSVGNATGALYAAMSAAGVAGGEVITTSFNFTGVPNAIVLAGGRPVFVDIDDKHWSMDAASLKKAIGKKTRAIVLTHVNMMSDLIQFHDVILEKGIDIPIIQDASLAVGSTWRGVRPGVINIGANASTVVSLAASKIISGLGGAMVVVNNPDVLNRVIAIAYQGVSFVQQGLLELFGSNVKMGDLNAAVAMEHLKKRQYLFDRRRRLKEIYDSGLRPLVKRKKIQIQDVGDEAVIAHYMARIPGRNEIAKRLNSKHGIYLGMWYTHHDQDIYIKRFGRQRGSLKVTSAIADEIAFLPFHTHLTDDDVTFICRALAEEVG